MRAAEPKDVVGDDAAIVFNRDEDVHGVAQLQRDANNQRERYQADDEVQLDDGTPEEDDGGGDDPTGGCVLRASFTTTTTRVSALPRRPKKAV